MQRSSWIRSLVLFCLVALPFSLSSAQPAAGEVIGGVDVNPVYWAGTGSNEAVMVVDFKATGGGPYAFGYRWDGVATGYDMLTAVAAAGDLDFTANYWPGMGYFIDNFTFRGEAGDPGKYWAYWLGTGNGGQVTWAEAAGGMSARTLTSGDFDGWYNGFDNTAPRLPEPATVMMIGVAGLFLRPRMRTVPGKC